VLDRHAAAGGVAIVHGELAGGGAAAIIAEWQTGKVLRVALTKSGSTYERAAAKTLLTGIKSPLPVAASASGFLVGDWSTGVVYRLTAADRT
jgi:hypothetical protein